MTALETRERRRRRATIAARVLASGADAISAIDWEMLDKAPAWLALPDAKLATLQRQIGALLYASRSGCGSTVPAWPRRAARSATPSCRRCSRNATCRHSRSDASARPRIDSAEKVATHLQVVGAAILLASMPQGALRRVVTVAMAPTAPAPIATELAHALVARAQTLASQGSASPLAGAPTGTARSSE